MYTLNYSLYYCISLCFFIIIGGKGHAGRQCFKQLSCHQVNSKEIRHSPVLKENPKTQSCFRRDKATLGGSEQPSSENIQARAV